MSFSVILFGLNHYNGDEFCARINAASPTVVCVVIARWSESNEKRTFVYICTRGPCCCVVGVIGQDGGGSSVWYNC